MSTRFTIRDENTRRSQSLWNWISHRPSRDYFLADYLGTRREREKNGEYHWRWRKFQRQNFIMGSKKRSDIWPSYAYISHGDTRSDSSILCILLFPPPCLGRNRSSTKHVWIYHNSYEFFCSFFEWLQGLPRIIKSSSVAKIQTKILGALEWWLSIASLKRIYF